LRCQATTESNLDDPGTSHYHCCICPAIYNRPEFFKNHLRTHTKVPDAAEDRESMSASESVGNTTLSECRDANTEATYECSLCNKAFSSKKSLQNHGRYFHISPDFISGRRHLNGICVDPDRGIYLMRRSFSGTSHPVHVIHDFGTDGGFSCELNECRELSNTARRSGNPRFVCSHLKSVQYISENAKSCYALPHRSLEELIGENVRWFKKSREQECLQLHAIAKNDKAPIIAEYVASKPLTSSRYQHFSVYDGKIHHYSRFKRVVVSYDKINNKWSCVCCRSKVNCVHKCIARWFIYEVRPEDLFTNACTGEESVQEGGNELDDASDDSETPSCSVSISSTSGDVYPPKQEGILSKMVEYIHRFKRIPLKLPRTLTHDVQTYPNILVPTENKCKYCEDVSLSEPKKIKRKGKIFTPTTVIDGKYTSICDLP
jgi:hypothetical protein